jgi:site-specific recombinase XerD
MYSNPLYMPFVIVYRCIERTLYEAIDTSLAGITADNSPSRSLVVADAGAVPETLGPELEEAAGYARAEKSAATRRAYRSDFELFRTWCETKHVLALPARPETVAAFLAAEANRGVKPSTIGRRLAAIRYAHKLAGHEPPTNSEAVKATLRGIRRIAGSAPARKAPATADKIVAMVEKVGADIKGLRDRALLLLGFAGAFPRSELVALDVADLKSCNGGLRVTICKSKTDQEGQGATIAIVPGSTACPINAVGIWIETAGILNGPLFRPVTRTGQVSGRRLSARAVADLVKTYARRAGLNAADFSGHSLRSGFLTSAAARGASIFKMMDVSRHKSIDTLRGYVRDAEMFRDHAGNGLL